MPTAGVAPCGRTEIANLGATGSVTTRRPVLSPWWVVSQSRRWLATDIVTGELRLTTLYSDHLRRHGSRDDPLFADRLCGYGLRDLGRSTRQPGREAVIHYLLDNPGSGHLLRRVFLAIGAPASTERLQNTNLSLHLPSRSLSCWRMIGRDARKTTACRNPVHGHPRLRGVGQTIPPTPVRIPPGLPHLISRHREEGVIKVHRRQRPRIFGTVRQSATDAADAVRCARRLVAAIAAWNANVAAAASPE